MGNIDKLQCMECFRPFSEKRELYTCQFCGSNISLDVWYNYQELKKTFTREWLSKNNNFTHWRYFPILPIKSLKSVSMLSVGWTPLYDAGSLAKKMGIRKIFIKDDGLNPTGSLKDRASSIAVARALEDGVKKITCASTGNAASSLAGLSASVGLEAFIFVPESAPAAKVTQLKIFGANVFLVKGSYEDAFNLSMMCVDEFKWYNRNSGINPYLIEGKKTVALEIAEQMNFKLPDWVFVAVGDGCTIAGVWKGFVDFLKLGFIKKIPKIVGVQAKGASPIYQAWHKKRQLTPMKPETMADSIAVGTPRSWKKAIRAVDETNGFFITVTDKEILGAMKLLGSTCGIFGEPAGVTGLAGLIKAVKNRMIPRSSSSLIIVTGNGLKDISSAQKVSGNIFKIPVDFSALKKEIKHLNI